MSQKNVTERLSRGKSLKHEADYVVDTGEIPFARVANETTQQQFPFFVTSSFRQLVKRETADRTDVIRISIPLLVVYDSNEIVSGDAEGTIQQQLVDMLYQEEIEIVHDDDTKRVRE